MSILGLLFQVPSPELFFINCLWLLIICHLCINIFHHVFDCVYSLIFLRPKWHYFFQLMCSLYSICSPLLDCSLFFRVVFFHYLFVRSSMFLRPKWDYFSCSCVHSTPFVRRYGAVSAIELMTVLPWRLLVSFFPA